MSETINQIIVWVGTALGGVSVASIITAIIVGCVKGGFNKAISKINVEEISERATNKVIEKVKEVSFKQSIEPIAKAELTKITEQANVFIEKAFEKTQEQYNKLLKVVESFAKYFENSVYITEEAKENLRKALKEAEIEPIIDHTIEIEQIVVENENEPKKAKSSVKVSR